MLRSRKLPWMISFILSVIYFIAFIKIASKDNSDEDGLLFGFCVWGGPAEIPNKKDGCTGSPINSHIISFIIDFMMALIVGYLYTKDKGCTIVLFKKQGKEAETKELAGVYATSAFVILMHGALHFLMDSPLINCYKDIPTGSVLNDLGHVVFGTFSFLLCLIIIGIGLEVSKYTVLVSSGFFAALVIFITRTIGNDLYLLPGLFCVTHPLSSFVGFFTKKGSSTTFSSTVGWMFAISTFVGILELTTCKDFFKAIGGHFYYDLTLHASVIYGLPYFVANERREYIAVNDVNIAANK